MHGNAPSRLGACVSAAITNWHLDNETYYLHRIQKTKVASSNRPDRSYLVSVFVTESLYS